MHSLLPSLWLLVAVDPPSLYEQVWQLAAHPRLVAAVSQALGGCRNLLCWSADWFLKQPGDGAFTGWHQASASLEGVGPGAGEPPSMWGDRIETCHWCCMLRFWENALRTGLPPINNSASRA